MLNVGQNSSPNRPRRTKPPWIDKIYESFWSSKDRLENANKAPNRRSKKKVESDRNEYLKKIILSKDEIIRDRDATINTMRQAFVYLVINGKKEGVDVERLWTASVAKVKNT